MKKKLMPGERGINILVLAACLVFVVESAKLFRQDPTPYSMGAMPLFLSILCTCCCLVTLISGLRAEKSIYPSFKERLRATIQHVLPRDILVIFGLFIAYCASLSVFKFILATPIFLWCCMTYLAKGNYLKNILYSGVTSLFIVVIFRYLFKVILP